MSRDDQCEGYLRSNADHLPALLVRCVSYYNRHVDIGDYIFKLCEECAATADDEPHAVVIRTKGNR